MNKSKYYTWRLRIGGTGQNVFAGTRKLKREVDLLNFYQSQHPKINVYTSPITY